MTARILTLNAGSSSLKTALYGAGPAPELTGAIDRIGTAPRLRARWADGRRVERDLTDGPGGQAGAMQAVLHLVGAAPPGADVAAVCHRIVHGGPDRGESAVLDAAQMQDLSRYCPYAPLHQPQNLEGVRSAMAAFPRALQVGCFDTAFHRGHPWVNDTFALPREFFDRGVRRYGFHGLSYDYISTVLAREWPRLHAGRVVVAHLGNGASMCGLRGGKSIDSTMGFTALDGLPMGTRSGQLDPGVVLYLMQAEGMDADAITDLLYRRSGLLGLSGISNDMRRLEASDDPAAAAAIDYFVTRIRRELAALAGSLGGLDGVVFTGGIGENSALVRAGVCAGMDWIGIAIDAAANARGDTVLTAAGSRVEVLVLKTDEESVLAREGRRHLGAGPAGS